MKFKTIFIFLIFLISVKFVQAFSCTAHCLAGSKTFDFPCCAIKCFCSETGYPDYTILSYFSQDVQCRSCQSYCDNNKYYQGYARCTGNSCDCPSCNYVASCSKAYGAECASDSECGSNKVCNLITCKCQSLIQETTPRTTTSSGTTQPPATTTTQQCIKL